MKAGGFPILLRAKGSIACSAPVPATPCPEIQPLLCREGRKLSPFHPFDHIGNADVTLVIDVVRIIFLLAFLVFLKSSSSSNRSCGQEATARQSNSGAAGSSSSWKPPRPTLTSHLEKLWPTLPEACFSLSCSSPSLPFSPSRLSLLVMLPLQGDNVPARCRGGTAAFCNVLVAT